MSPNGVAVFPNFDAVLKRISGIGKLRSAQTSPAKIPNIIGGFTTPINVFFNVFLSRLPPPGRKMVSAATATMLYKGTLPIIISGPMPLVP